MRIPVLPLVLLLAGCSSLPGDRDGSVAWDVDVQPHADAPYALLVPFLDPGPFHPGEDRPLRNVEAVSALRNATPAVAGALSLTFVNATWAHVAGHGPAHARFALAVPRGSALWEAHAHAADTNATLESGPPLRLAWRMDFDFDGHGCSVVETLDGNLTGPGRAALAYGGSGMCAD